MILALETATATGSVALYDDKLVGEYTLGIRRTHSERLLPAVVRILEDAQLTVGDLSALTVSLGPGSFTGLRIGIMTAKTLAWSLDLPLLGIPTLDAMAWSMRYCRGLLCPALDCRRGEAYSALYIADGSSEPQRQTEYLALPLEELKARAEAFSLVKYWYGDLDLTGQGGIVVTGGHSLPRAGSVAELAQRRLASGDSDDPASLVPLYVRKSAARPRRALNASLSSDNR
jgi:tRNA threonylcarbamoyladenosine biosynthesis protein TsaB